jgi:predicted peroxiredoxin
VNKAKGGFSLKQENYNKELEKEKEKLNRLADKALESGIPLTQDEAFMAQNRKVDELIVKIQMEKERHRNKQRER